MILLLVVIVTTNVADTHTDTHTHTHTHTHTVSMLIHTVFNYALAHTAAVWINKIEIKRNLTAKLT